MTTRDGSNFCSFQILKSKSGIGVVQNRHWDGTACGSNNSSDSGCFGRTTTTTIKLLPLAWCSFPKGSSWHGYPPKVSLSWFLRCMAVKDRGGCLSRGIAKRGGGDLHEDEDDDHAEEAEEASAEFGVGGWSWGGGQKIGKEASAHPLYFLELLVNISNAQHGLSLKRKQDGSTETGRGKTIHH